jgi:sugar/nucleoside kinase (ribokinase family)
MFHLEIDGMREFNKNTTFDIIGLTNAIVDAVVKVSDEDIIDLGFKKGHGNKKSDIDYNKFENFIFNNKIEYVSGGSPFNTIRGLSNLGLKSAILGAIGDDKYGQIFMDDCLKFKVTPMIGIFRGNTGLCHVLVSPDGDRTMVADIGVSKNFEFYYDSGRTKIFHTSGYELSSNRLKTLEILDYYKGDGSKISFDLASPNSVKKNKDIIVDLLSKVDVLFSTAGEFDALSKISKIKSLDDLSKIVPIINLKLGSSGSILRVGSEQHNIPIYPVTMVNTIGAGDSYAAGFLYKYIKNSNLIDCAYHASFIASRVCAKKESYY